jgi:peptide/nickel transport system ATP-binding protein
VTPGPEPLLAVHDLEVGFQTRRGRLRALDRVSLELAEGEVLGVVGESGAGKSLAAAAIVGLLPGTARITGGEVRLLGQRIDRLSERELRRIRGGTVGIVFQDPATALDPLYTVGQQLVETIRTHLSLSRAAARARAVELLRQVGIPAAATRIDHYPHQLSGGMRQRAVIALALAAGPRLLIADEPTSALDVSVQAQIIALLKQLGREYRLAVMLITHDMGVIAEIADRVAVMYAGRVVEIGPVREVLRRPAHPYTRGLMDAIPTLIRLSSRLPQIEGAMPGLGRVPPGCAFHDRCAWTGPRCRTMRPELMPAGLSLAACWLNEPRHGVAA